MLHRFDTADRARLAGHREHTINGRPIGVCGTAVWVRRAGLSARCDAIDFEAELARGVTNGDPSDPARRLRARSRRRRRDAGRSGAVNRIERQGADAWEHPGAKLVLAHLDDPEAFRSGGLAPDQENPLPRDSERLRNEPQQPRIRPATFRGRDHVDPEYSVPETADPVARRSGLHSNFHLDVPRTGVAHHLVSVSTGSGSRPARREHHWSTLPACRATASPRS